MLTTFSLICIHILSRDYILHKFNQTQNWVKCLNDILRVIPRTKIPKWYFTTFSLPNLN
ncbi:hypothetical protein CLCAR_3709 [Clostridium carboxidivorans P7]|nr:hypothetical protein CLCAR_3709 [Clostridium carboxidivorans P7]